MDAQTYYDKTVDHLRQQGVRATTGTTCTFSDACGRSCAIGAHIPKDHPASKMPGESFTWLREEYPELAGIAWPDTPQGVRLASRLQALHDRYINWNHKAGRFGLVGETHAQEIAELYGLVYTPPS